MMNRVGTVVGAMVFALGSHAAAQSCVPGWNIFYTNTNCVTYARSQVTLPATALSASTTPTK